MSWAEITRKWKSRSSIRTIVLLAIMVLLIIGLYYWWRSVFYALPELAAILLVVVSARALAPELQEKLAKPTRILLVCLLSAAGIGGIVSNRFQRSEQENRASSENNQLSNRLEGIEQSVNRLVAEGKLTKEDAAKILGRASNLREGDHVRLSISCAGNESFNAEVMCLVTDPENHSYWSGTLASGTGITGLDFYVLYPGSFKGAPPLRPGTYNVTWIMAADSKQVIATDSFEIPVNR